MSKSCKEIKEELRELKRFMAWEIVNNISPKEFTEKYRKDFSYKWQFGEIKEKEYNVPRNLNQLKR